MTAFDTHRPPLREDWWARQVICYESGDYSGPHNDHHPQRAEADREFDQEDQQREPEGKGPERAVVAQGRARGGRRDEILATFAYEEGAVHAMDRRFTVSPLIATWLEERYGLKFGEFLALGASWLVRETWGVSGEIAAMPVLKTTVPTPCSILMTFDSSAVAVGLPWRPYE